jgi:hypothetical protein
MITVDEAIGQADAMLPGRSAPDGEVDQRWQAIIRVGEFVESDPDAVWDFVRKWAPVADEDLRMALATCLVEHLLEHHFDKYFFEVRSAARSDLAIADIVTKCWSFEANADSALAQSIENLKREIVDGAI